MEKIMKQFKGIAILLGISVLVISVCFQVTTASAASEDVNISVTCAFMRIAPVFDSTGAVVSDPAGTILNATHSVTCGEMKIAPVFDITGAVVSDPTGTLSNAPHLAAGADMKIAPVFDTTGAVVSDPTGTLSNVINP
jgi:hypothetical protein